MQEKVLSRSNDKLVAGVAGGIADYLNIDPTLVRIIFILLMMGGGHGFIIYAVLWFIMPENKATQKDAYEEMMEEIKVQDA